MEEKVQAFGQLIRQYKSTIYSVCYMFSEDHDEIADLFQETMIHLWKGFDNFRGQSQPKTWVYRVTMNTCISLDRKKKTRAQQVPLDMDINLYEDQDNDTKQVQILYNRIHQLGLIDRAIVMLWLENMSYEEIGQIIGISAKNVSVKLVRIKEKLKQLQ